MKPETEAWVNKAEGNWRSALWGMGAPQPVRDDICFLCQQCGEKYIKVFLREHEIGPPREHDLIALISMTGGLLADMDAYRQELALLSSLSVATRYPGLVAAEQDAEDAVKAAGTVRAVIRLKLGLGA